MSLPRRARVIALARAKSLVEWRASTGIHLWSASTRRTKGEISPFSLSEFSANLVGKVVFLHDYSQAAYPVVPQPVMSVTGIHKFFDREMQTASVAVSECANRSKIDVPSRASLIFVSAKYCSIISISRWKPTFFEETRFLLGFRPRSSIGIHSSHSLPHLELSSTCV